MKTIFFLVLIGMASQHCKCQERTAKEKAEAIAKEVFSKLKRKKKEKDGVVSEVNRKVVSVPVINNSPEFYAGNYWYKDLNYKIEIRLDPNKQFIAVLSIPSEGKMKFEKVTITDAYFLGVQQSKDGNNESWQGVFINKSDNGSVEFGLGIKLSKPIDLIEGYQTTKLFLKKVSP